MKRSSTTICTIIFLQMIRIGWSIAKRKVRYVSLHCVLLHNNDDGVGADRVVDVVDFDGHRA